MGQVFKLPFGVVGHYEPPSTCTKRRGTYGSPRGGAEQPFLSASGPPPPSRAVGFKRRRQGHIHPVNLHRKCIKTAPNPPTCGVAGVVTRARQVSRGQGGQVWLVVPP
ncbi:hypothetical protein GWK47_029389 [Chionoecetes opilio]|uniref:Uncharacterized protein n=1 Tax=Chionoecetes opilio TaxID=41210 RepID=A0A8J4YN40_CHIOP|nr:hypothetical protein GWK47_029389 [Chionoecetes opilio]